MTGCVKYPQHGMRFVAASDDANQQLVRGPFDGRRLVMTRAPPRAGRPLKLPVYGFYELLGLLGDRRCRVAGPDDPPTAAGLRRLATIGPDQIAVLFTSCPDDEGGPGWDIDYVLRSIKWPRVNVVWFRIDQTHGNAFAAAGGRMPAVLNGPDAVRAVRARGRAGGCRSDPVRDRAGRRDAPRAPASRAVCHHAGLDHPVFQPIDRPRPAGWSPR